MTALQLAIDRMRNDDSITGLNDAIIYAESLLSLDRTQHTNSYLQGHLDRVNNVETATGFNKHFKELSDENSDTGRD